jgi:hypothetical protein
MMLRESLALVGLGSAGRHGAATPQPARGGDALRPVAGRSVTLPGDGGDAGRRCAVASSLPRCARRATRTDEALREE